VRGRAIRAIELGDPSSPRKVLVVGVIHGNEQAGLPIAAALAAGAPIAGVDLWIVPTINPDGIAADTRQNAHAVDLNRNFPYRWRPVEEPGGSYYSGRRALSEPETRAVVRLVRRLRPAVTIWFHQHLRMVEQPNGNRSVARRFARLVGLRYGPLPFYSGTETSWSNHTFPGTSSFVAELPAGTPSAADVRRYVRAVRAVAK
jgi:murein peptide amidase A